MTDRQLIPARETRTELKVLNSRFIATASRVIAAAVIYNSAELFISPRAARVRIGAAW